MAAEYYSKYDNRRRIKCILLTDSKWLDNGMAKLKPVLKKADKDDSIKKVEVALRCTKWITYLGESKSKRKPKPDDELFSWTAIRDTPDF